MDISKYIGIPYRNKGRTEEGCDCFGLVKLISKNELNIDIPEYTYRDAEDASQASRTLTSGREEWMKVIKPRIGDVIMLRISGLPVHIGLVIDSRRMIHSLRGHNSAIELFDCDKWKNRIDGFYRYESDK